MKRNFRKKMLHFLCAATLICGGTGMMLGSSQPGTAGIKGEDKVVYQSALFNWRLVGMPYTITDYSSKVRVFDPNGNPVEITSQGKITLTVAGEYVIVYPSGAERLYALLEEPVSMLELLGEIESKYPAGTTLTLPALSAENEVYDFAYYYVEVWLDSAHLETLKVKDGESTVYLMKKDGEYQFKYYVLNDRGEKESISITTTAEKEKAVLLGELPERVKVGDSFSLGYPYAFYEETVYDVSVSVTFNGEETQVKAQSFTPTSAGEYTFAFSAQISGETVTVEKVVTAYVPDNALFEVASGIGESQGVQTLPSWNTNSNYEEGLLIKGSSDKVKFNYTGLIDLSTLTKEDNLLTFLPYSDMEAGAYMEALRVVFTDAHDASRKISLYFWSSARNTGETMPSSYVMVEIDGKRYGIDNHRNAGAFSSVGSTAYFSSFMGAYNNASDTFTIQYDYATDVLYLMTERNATLYPMQQYVLLPLSGKGTLDQGIARLPEESWFKGFTTGEVYMSVEMISNKNAGIYLCEIAGMKASEWQADRLENFLIFEEAMKEPPMGIVGYEYLIPTARINDYFGEASNASVTVKDGQGQTVQVKNGKFTPATAGEYTLTYWTEYFGERLEKTYTVIVAAEPVEIAIEATVSQPIFGGYMDVPEITLSGGNGKLEYSYQVLLGGKEISLDGNGKYLIAKEGAVEIVVVAKDATGYEKTQTFAVQVQDGGLFALEKKMDTAIRIGWAMKVPTATVTSLVGGIYATQTVTAKVYENGEEKELSNGSFTPSAQATSVRFVYEYTVGNETFAQEFEPTVLPEEVLTVTEYILTQGAVEKGITEKGILLAVTGDATANMPYPVAAENLLLTVGFHKDGGTIDHWDFVLRDTETPDLLVRLTFSNFSADSGTVSLSLNGAEQQILTGRTNVYTQYCGDEAAVEKFAGKEYVVFSLSLNSAKAILQDYETQKTIFNLTTFENGGKFVGFTNSACMVETSITKTSAGESNVLLCQVGNQYFNYGEDTFGYYDSDGVPPTIVVNGDTSSKSVAYGYTLNIPSAIAYDVLGGNSSVKVRIMANGEEVLSARSAVQAFDFIVNEYKSYAIIYEAVDMAGNRAKLQFNISVLDEEAPTLTVDGTYAATVKRGEKVKILSFAASDGQGEVKTLVFVKDNQTKLTFVKVGSEYTFTKNGVYEIVYRSVDSVGNITRKSFTIVVE